MKGITGVLVGILVVILIIIGFASLQGNDNNDLADGEGRVYFGITDDTADIQSVNEIEMEVRKVEVYSQAKGWTTVSSDSKSYALLKLKADGKVELYDSAKLKAGNYDQVRVTLGDVTIDSDSKARAKAVLPSEQITFNANVVVEDGQDSHVTLDFIADQSLHVSTNGEYVFAPVVEVETRSKTKVEVKDDKSVIVTGGTVDSKTSVGVDLDGTAKTGFKLNSSEGLEVNSSTSGDTTFKLGGTTYIKGNLSGSVGTGSDTDSDSDDTDNEDDTSVEGSSNTEGSVRTGGNGASVDVETNTGIDANL